MVIRLRENTGVLSKIGTARFFVSFYFMSLDTLNRRVTKCWTRWEGAV